jgi:hypothetical protein
MVSNCARDIRRRQSGLNFALGVQMMSHQGQVDASSYRDRGRRIQVLEEGEGIGEGLARWGRFIKINKAKIHVGG